MLFLGNLYNGYTNIKVFFRIILDKNPAKCYVLQRSISTHEHRVLTGGAS